MINEPLDTALDTEPCGTESESEAPATSYETPETDGENAAQPAPETDYSRLVEEDMRSLSEELTDGREIRITDLKDPLRYGALRDLGLTPKEAYLASGGRKERADNRAHLSSSVPRRMTASFSEIPRAELDAARELFSDMSDSEIRNLYKKVTK